MNKHKVGLRDSVSDHMKRELAWRSTIRLTTIMTMFGLALVLIGSTNPSIAIVNFPIRIIGFVLIIITLLLFSFKLSDRKWFKQTYEYHEKEK